MNSYKVSDTHMIPDNIDELIEKCFGEYRKESQDEYVIDDPDSIVLKEVNIKIESNNTILLDIEEISITEARDKNVLGAVPNAFQYKNSFLRKVTGKTVEDRKKELRSEVTDEIPTEKIDKLT